MGGALDAIRMTDSFFKHVQLARARLTPSWRPRAEAGAARGGGATPGADRGAGPEPEPPGAPEASPLAGAPVRSVKLRYSAPLFRRIYTDRVQPHPSLLCLPTVEDLSSVRRLLSYCREAFAIYGTYNTEYLLRHREGEVPCVQSPARNAERFFGGLAKSSRITARRELACFARSLDLDPANVVLYSRKNLRFVQPFAISVCPALREIHLVVRGSLSFHDVVTDLCVETVALQSPPVNFADESLHLAGGRPLRAEDRARLLASMPAAGPYYGHFGIYVASSYIYYLTRDLLRFLLRRYEGYVLVFLGHSLGAAVANLLGWFWITGSEDVADAEPSASERHDGELFAPEAGDSEPPPPGPPSPPGTPSGPSMRPYKVSASMRARVRVVGFGCPGAFSPQVGRDLRGCATNVCFGTDLITRVGIDGLVHLWWRLALLGEIRRRRRSGLHRVRSQPAMGPGAGAGAGVGAAGGANEASEASDVNEVNEVSGAGDVGAVGGGTPGAAVDGEIEGSCGTPARSPPSLPSPAGEPQEAQAPPSRPFELPLPTRPRKPAPDVVSGVDPSPQPTPSAGSRTPSRSPGPPRRARELAAEVEVVAAAAERLEGTEVSGRALAAIPGDPPNREYSRTRLVEQIERVKDGFSTAGALSGLGPDATHPSDPEVDADPSPEASQPSEPETPASQVVSLPASPSGCPSPLASGSSTQSSRSSSPGASASSGSSSSSDLGDSESSESSGSQPEGPARPAAPGPASEPDSRLPSRPAGPKPRFSLFRRLGRFGPPKLPQGAHGARTGRRRPSRAVDSPTSPTAEPDPGSFPDLEESLREEVDERLDSALPPATLEDRTLEELQAEYRLPFFETEIEENRFTMDIPGRVLFLSFGCGPAVLTWRELRALLRRSPGVAWDGLRRAFRIPPEFNCGLPLVRLQVAAPGLAKEVFACREAWTHHVSYYQGLLLLLYHLEGRAISLRV